MSERKAFVVGRPINHSRSPLIHGTWLERYNVADGEYGAIDVGAEELFGLLQRVRKGEFRGGNVTIPHKETVFAEVEQRDEAAQAIGAVNTLWVENGELVGGNTDAYGFAANLDENAPGWSDGGTALVLGAGGASRAVLHALLSRGFETVWLANRTAARAEDLATHFGPKVRALPWDQVPETLGGAKLLVNTTALGMEGGEALDLDLEKLPEGAVVTDIVYVPLETPLLKAARERGNVRVVDGLGMLLHQAAPGFERWFGVRPEVTRELRDLVVADLERPKTP